MYYIGLRNYTVYVIYTPRFRDTIICLVKYDPYNGYSVVDTEIIYGLHAYSHSSYTLYKIGLKNLNFDMSVHNEWIDLELCSFTPKTFFSREKNELNTTLLSSDSESNRRITDSSSMIYDIKPTDQLSINSVYDFIKVILNSSTKNRNSLSPGSNTSIRSFLSGLRLPFSNENIAKDWFNRVLLELYQQPVETI